MSEAGKAQYPDLGQRYRLFLLVTKVFPREGGARLAAQALARTTRFSLPARRARLTSPCLGVHTLRGNQISLPGATELLPSQRPPQY